MKKIIITILVVNFLCMPTFALSFDTSVDDDIRRNYNPSKLEEDVALPALPKIIKEDKQPAIKPVSTIKKSQSQQIQSPKVDVQKNGITKVDIPKADDLQKINNSDISAVSPLVMKKSATRNYAVLKKGTKIRLKSLSNFSEATKKGTQLSFVSVLPVTTTCYTIPMGTTFNGKIIDSHRPQFAANGGLIKFNITSVVLNEGVQPINASVTKANKKLVFFNNIKGKRRYFKSMYSSTRHGRHFFNKMLNLTVRLASDGSSIVVAPFSLASGVIAVGGNALVSPVLALFHKGGSISLPAGSEYDVKLLQDVFVYY